MLSILCHFHGLFFGAISLAISRLFDRRVRTADCSQSIVGQEMNDWTRRAVGRGIAGAYKTREGLLYLREVRDLLLNQFQLVSRDPACFQTCFLFIQCKETKNFFQRESEALRPLDETDSLHRIQRIPAKAPSWPYRLQKQTTPLIVPDRLDIYATALCECANCQVFGHAFSPLTPYHGTGFRVK